MALWVQHLDDLNLEKYGFLISIDASVASDFKVAESMKGYERI